MERSEWKWSVGTVLAVAAIGIPWWFNRTTARAMPAITAVELAGIHWHLPFGSKSEMVRFEIAVQNAGKDVSQHTQVQYRLLFIPDPRGPKAIPTTGTFQLASDINPGTTMTFDENVPTDYGLIGAARTAPTLIVLQCKILYRDDIQGSQITNAACFAGAMMRSKFEPCSHTALTSLQQLREPW